MENNGFVLGPLSVRPLNSHDPVILPEALTALVDFTTRLDIDVSGSA